jgi:hypothetical protein
MTRRLTVAFAALTLALTALTTQAQAAFPMNPNFAGGLEGWSAPETCRLEGDALSLSDGVVVSDPSEAPLSGWQQVTVRVKGPGARSESALTVALASGGSEGPAQVALSAEQAGGGWRRLSAELLPPPGTPASVALGVAGEGRWLIDSVAVGPAQLPETEIDRPAVLPEPLPEGWQPDGLLDAVERPLGRTSELLLSVGALEVALPPQVTAPRAHRGTVGLTVRNRASTDRTLTLAVTGPPGFFAPERTVTIRPGRDTVFEASVQAFFVGTRWARMTFRSGETEASAPIRVTVEPSYPAPGVSFTGGEPPASALDALAGASIPLVAAPPGPPLPEHLARLRLLPLPWSEQAVRSGARELAGQADFAALHHPRGTLPDAPGGAATKMLREALTEAKATAGTLGPPVDLQPGPPVQIADEDLAMTRDLASAGAISAPNLRLPVLDGRPARAVTLGRRPLESAQPAWTEFARSIAVDGVAEAIRAEVRMPMFFGDLAAHGTGSPQADAAMLARALAVCAWQGATGWTVPARPQDAPEGAAGFCPLADDGTPNGPVARAYSELSRELAAAVPLVILKQTPEIGSAPDAQVGFRPFMRNDEGIVALWNNTGAPIELAVEVRTQPLDVHTVSVGPDGVRRGYVGNFHFSEDAITLNRPVLFVTLQPAEVKVLSMQLARPHIGWLASVERKPEITREDDERESFLDEWGGQRGYR